MQKRKGFVIKIQVFEIFYYVTWKWTKSSTNLFERILGWYFLIRLLTTK